jgi:squalene-hopene/tetraprenyl-beta-curcumene cyclase
VANIHNDRLIESGLDWLVQHQNEDGGWGDTVKSQSNISTTTLVWAALGMAPKATPEFREALAGAESWLTRRAGGVTPHQIGPAIIARYGKDRTFSVPILTHCALAGRLGIGPDAWRHVLPLPFELAALPHQLFAALRLPVVSYALPALIAIGQARFRQAPPLNPFSRLLRHWTADRTLRVLTRLQPVNGGFLEATPLTSFVTMSLAGSGLVDHEVTRRGVEFLVSAQRPDGSWPIDTNLTTWVTTLALNALGLEEDSAVPPGGLPKREAVRSWLLDQQYRIEHPYTHASPGGWAWTDLPGGVPDADDTAGALLALRRFAADDSVQAAAARAVDWLLSLQNRDGGIPTFCRGWGALPFDRSSADITAHTIRAWRAWHADLPASLQDRLREALNRAVVFLARTQHPDGSWLPLWFGNERAADDGNPLYGTSRVLCALAEITAEEALAKAFNPLVVDGAVNWLVAAQNEDGGWGGERAVESSVEETALAVEALATALGRGANPDATLAAWERGVIWLMNKVDDGSWKEPSPIGFYFAKLWYYEELYPIIFTVGALRRSMERLG